MRPIILGQAPSRKGHGEPFTGPSGDTLCRWAGVADRNELLRHFVLDNLLDQPLPLKEPHESSTFTPGIARTAAKAFIDRHDERLKQELSSVELDDLGMLPVNVVVLGAKVWRAFGLPRDSELFGQEPVADHYCMFRFPHPSGLNHQLNNPQLRLAAKRSLRLIGSLPLTD